MDLSSVNTNLPGSYSQAAVNVESVVAAAEFAVAEQGLKLEKIVSAQPEQTADERSDFQNNYARYKSPANTALDSSIQYAQNSAAKGCKI